MSIINQKDFEFDAVLQKPLMAHLSTVEVDELRDSLVWFIWEYESVKNDFEIHRSRKRWQYFTRETI